MKLTVNGEPHAFSSPTLTVAELIGALGLAGQRVAVERNRRIVPRATHADSPLSDGDIIEIVHFVGGG